jgi:hypothetical protein
MPRALSALLLLSLLLAAVAVRPEAAAAHGGGAGCIDGEELAVLGLINDYRAANGLAPLWLSQTLSAAAEHHSASMATHGYFAHDLLAEGTGWSENIVNHGYGYDTWLGENIAGGQWDAWVAFDDWRNSPSHNAAMLSPHYAAIGIGWVYDEESLYGWHWTTTFGGLVDAPAALCGGGMAAAPTAGSVTLAGGSTKLAIVDGGRSGNSVAAELAYDGDVSTSWRTATKGVESSYVWFDLGSERSLGAVRWLFGKTGGADAMLVQTSTDKQAWTTIGTPGNAAAGAWQELATEGRARYVRFVFQNPNGDARLGHLAEVEILG